MGDVDREELLKQFLPLLADRGIARRWTGRASPLADLAAECQMIVRDENVRAPVQAYLRGRPVIRESVETMLAQLAMAAGARWHDVAPVLQPLARRGWHIGRWLPTFLLVDGPLARFLRDPESPVNVLLRTRPGQLPLLAQARDAFNHDLFRRVRNGFGHWSFVWQDNPEGTQITILNWETGEESARPSLLEAEGLHLFSIAVIQTLDREVFSLLGAERAV